MRDGQGSRTAERVAIRRAAHQLLDRPPVFVDPLAVRIIDPRVAAQLASEPQEVEASPLSTYLRAFMAVRSRFAEDALRDAVGRGVRQYVILGAGYDTFAYRNPFDDLRVFEVDHPATQANKRARLAGAGIPIPDSLTFVAIDFATTEIGAALAAAGFDVSAPTFISWLGVVPYLEREAIADTLRWAGALSRGSAIVFDYGVPPESLSVRSRAAVEWLARRVASAGEPWRTFLTPAETRALLTASGFHHVEDLGPPELDARYLAGRPNGLRIGEAGRLVCASV